MLINLFTLMFNMIFPRKFVDACNEKFKEIKKAFTKSFTLRLFFKILKVIIYIAFFPITLTIHLLIALAKSIYIIFTSKRRYWDTIYIIRELYNDIVANRFSFRNAVKRARLRNELLTKGKEKKVSYGEENPDITFFVIRPFYFMVENELVTAISNLLYHYYRNLQHMSYAIENGWVPVVDWENYGPFRHQEDYPVNGTNNCWEYYWEQPSGYTLEEVYRSKNVVLSEQNTKNYGYIPSVEIKPPFSKYVQQLATKCPKYDQNIKLNEVTSKYIDEHYEKLFPKDARVLGVSVRATSYGSCGKKTVKNHPIQPQTIDLIKRVKQAIEEWEMEYIFFACEGEEVVKAMREEFGDKLITLPRLRYEEDPESFETNPLYAKGQRYQTNLDYLTEMVLLSRCTSLIAGISGGVRAAVIWNANKYEHCEIIDNGLSK